jgi:lipopolysaccharide/colanic/teichoic acid biosynthesis glycosyltransferase
MDNRDQTSSKLDASLVIRNCTGVTLVLAAGEKGQSAMPTVTSVKTVKAVTVGDVLIDEQLITTRQLNYALEEQQEEAQHAQKYLLGEIFIRWGLITQAELIHALNQQYFLNEGHRFGTQIHRSVKSKSKRAIDIVGAIFGLTITLFLLPFIALAIYLEDRGPIFFSQPRMGLRGKQFTIFKFRSMVLNAERKKVTSSSNYKLFDLEEDQRVTRLGAFLRKTSLDEFPQFWNVLKGEMSLVGTRPPTLDEVKNYAEEEWLRLSVRPGLTGLWQLSYQRRRKDFASILALDMQYQSEWNLWCDVNLVLKTIKHVLFSRKR